MAEVYANDMPRRSEVNPLVNRDSEFTYTVAPLGRRVILLTIGRVAVIGEWKGAYGEYFLGWHHMPKTNRTIESALGFAHPKPERSMFDKEEKQ